MCYKKRKAEQNQRSGGNFRQRISYQKSDLNKKEKDVKEVRNAQSGEKEMGEHSMFKLKEEYQCIGQVRGKEQELDGKGW